MDSPIPKIVLTDVDAAPKRTFAEFRHHLSLTKVIREVSAKFLRSEPPAPEFNPNLLHPGWTSRKDAENKFEEAEKAFRAALEMCLRPRADSPLEFDAQGRLIENSNNASATGSAAASTTASAKGAVKDSVKDNVEGSAQNPTEKEEKETGTLYTVIGESEGGAIAQQDSQQSPLRSKSPLPELDDTWWSDGANLFSNSNSSENTLLAHATLSMGSSDANPSTPLADRSAQHTTAKPTRAPKGAGDSTPDDGMALLRCEVTEV